MTENLKIIVGLGNPGPEYLDSRHNAGFKLVEFWARQAEADNQVAAKGQAEIKWQMAKKFQAEVAKTQTHLWLKPQTFMNNSGQAVRAVLDYYWHFNLQSPASQAKLLQDLLVVHDDLDIVFGEAKLQFGKGPKVHNGLLSIYQHVGSQNFWHARIGVDGRGTERKIPAKNYVLQTWNVEEQLAWKTLPPKWVSEWQGKWK